MYKRATILLSLFLAITTFAMADEVTLTTKGGRYQKITSLDEITNGTIVIIASHSTKDDQDEIKVMTTASTTHTNMFGYYNTHMPYTSDMPDYISVNPVNTTVDGEEQAYEYVVTGASLNAKGDIKTYYLHDINGDYLNEQSEQVLNLVDTKVANSLLKSINGNEEPWKIYAKSNNSIVCDNYQSDYRDNGYYYLKNSSAANFIPAYLYKKLDVTTLEFGDYGNATLYYGENDVRLPNDLTAYTLNIKDGKIIIEHIFYGGTTIPHGTAVMLSGRPHTSYDIELLSPSQEYTGNNILKGFDTDQTTTGGSEYYKLSTGSQGIAFYYGAANGAAFTSQAHKAYLCLPAQHAAKAATFALPDLDTYTSNAKVSEEKANTNAVAYDLMGRKTTPNHQGIRIINGKAYAK